MARLAAAGRGAPMPAQAFDDRTPVTTILAHYPNLAHDLGNGPWLQQQPGFQTTITPQPLPQWLNVVDRYGPAALMARGLLPPRQGTVPSPNVAAVPARQTAQPQPAPGVLPPNNGRLGSNPTFVSPGTGPVFQTQVAGPGRVFQVNVGWGIPRPRIEQHHSDPVFMGGARNQRTTPLPMGTHRGPGRSLHNELNQFLGGRTDAAGNNMRPQRGNPGARIRENFTRQERLNALADFYKQFGDRYPDAARDFFNQHPHLR